MTRLRGAKFKGVKISDLQRRFFFHPTIVSPSFFGYFIAYFSNQSFRVTILRYEPFGILSRVPREHVR